MGSYRDVPVLITAPARGLDWGSYSNAYRWVHIGNDGIRSDLRIAGQYQRLEVIAPGTTAMLGVQPLLLLAYDSARKVESVQGKITAPDGSIQSPELTPRGDWASNIPVPSMCCTLPLLSPEAACMLPSRTQTRGRRAAVFSALIWRQVRNFGGVTSLDTLAILLQESLVVV